jgi:hypothetical protein
MKQATLLKSVDAFGWRVVKLSLPAGHSYGVLAGADRPRSSVGTITLFTKGRITGTNLTTGEQLSDRLPGLMSNTLDAIKSGRYVLTAAEDSEWWCLDERVNGGLLPGVTLVNAEEGQVVEGMCLVCSGPNDGLVATDYAAPEPCMVLVFDRSR